MTKYAIEFHNVGKQYRLGMVGTGSLQHDINRWWQTAVMRREDPYLKIGEVNDRATKGNSDYVWALKDISFNVEKGDVVGIIGKNGAGKSTLLKLLSHITAPSTGHIRYRGRIASLLEVGTGFVGDLTARQNIYMNGSIMGMTKHEITSKLDEIIDFAGIERYLDTPVKRFSSGMYVRLGFAVAAHLDPEILVVDEVLAVGDIEFQKKAIGKMQDVSQGQGRTVLFVSHNMSSVRAICNKGIVLENGMRVFDGGVDDAVDYYITSNNDTYFNSVEIRDCHRRSTQTKELELIAASILNVDIKNIATNEPIKLSVAIKVNEKKTSYFTIGFHITDHEGKRVGAYVSPITKVPIDRDDFTISILFKNHSLAKGRYTIDFDLCLKDIGLGEKNYDVTYNVLSFAVTNIEKGKPIGFWPNHWGRINFQNVEINVE